MVVSRTRLESLPEDLILYLLMGFEVTSLLKFRQTCRCVYSVSKAKQLWVNLYHHEDPETIMRFPPYWKPIDAMDGSQLEKLVLHMLRLGFRKDTHQTPFTVPFNQKRSVTWLRLIQSHWLLVASSDDINSSVSLWTIQDLLSSNVTPVTEVFLPAPAVNGAVDIQGSTVVFALELRGRHDQVDVLSITDAGAGPRICWLQTINDVGQLRFLRGHHIGVTLVHNINVPCVIEWPSHSIRHLRCSPDTEGGAIAMYPGDGWVAIVRRTVIEVYVLRDGCPTYWKKISLPYVVGTAAFSQAMAPSPLRVCITSTPSIYVYGIEVNIAEGQLTKVDLWHYHDQTPLRPNIYPAPTCGQLGVTSNNVSWLEGNLCDSATPARFCTSSLNNHRGNPRIFGWYDDKAPMLSVLGVYDFDESRGILALGNALGELSIVDFSKSDPTWFSECSINPLKPIKYTGQKLLPVEPIMSYSIFHFPIFGYSEQIKADVLANWMKTRPEVVPQGWKTNLEEQYSAASWFFGFAGVLEPWSNLWALSNVANFYGRPNPILYRLDDNCVKWVICDVGGLLFVHCEEYAVEPLLIPPSVTLTQLAEVIVAYQLRAEEVVYDAAADMFGVRFVIANLWHTRCVELSARGGRVGERWLHPLKRPIF